MPEVIARRNSFQQTLVQLRYDAGPQERADLFSRACVENYRELQLDHYGYSFTQVFEPGVLKEVALLEGRPYEPLADLSDRPGPEITRLAELADGADGLPVVALVNVASALISVCRFGPAARVLELAGARAASPREKFEIATLEFMLSNRRDDGVTSPQAFRRIREAIEAGGVPRERVIDVCSQAVVWYLKRREVSDGDFRWFVMTGSALVKNSAALDPTTRSGWNRAVAMIPAGSGQADATRRYMERAREAAQEAITLRPRAYEMNFLKTYYESALKEHTYLTRDYGRAQEAGEALIALDPVWPLSYAEVAEVHKKFGDTERAAGMFEKAAALGPPYVGHHLVAAARCHEALGNDERAVSQYLALAEIAPLSESCAAAALRLADKLSHPARARLQSAVSRIAEPSAGPAR